MSITSDIFNGCDPFLDKPIDNNEYDLAREKVQNLQRELIQHLDEAGREAFDRYDEATNEMYTILLEFCFDQGYKVGVTSIVKGILKD